MIYGIPPPARKSWSNRIRRWSLDCWTIKFADAARIISALLEQIRKLFYARMGDPNTPEGKAQLVRQSPLSAAAKIKTPLLVIQGANDPRVNKRESDQIVIALRDRGFPVEYMVAPDDSLQTLQALGIGIDCSCCGDHARGTVQTLGHCEIGVFGPLRPAYCGNSPALSWKIAQDRWVISPLGATRLMKC